MASRPALAVALTRRHLSVVLATERGGRLAVKKIHETVVPDGTGEDPAARGAWLGRELRDAGFPLGRATVLLPREQLGFKRLTLPSTDPVELPGMVRLALQRDLPFDATGAVIDFLPVELSVSRTGVVAWAAPANVVEEINATCEAAGLKIERLAPRDLAMAALADTGPDVPMTPRLAIDVTPDHVGFCVIADGAVRFSRSAPLDRSAGVPAIVTETRRTWMSYRIVDDAESVDDAIIFGDALATDAAGAIGEVLSVTVRVADRHPLIVLREPPGHAWPLLGALLENIRDRETIDLAHPRRPPDTGARRRQGWLAAAGLLLIVVASVYVGATVRHRNLKETFEAVSAQANEARPGRLRYKRDALKLEHARRWEQTHVDWLAHLGDVAALARDPGTVVLDEWSGSLDFRGVRYDRDDGWSVPGTVRLGVQGEAADRATADAFRAALVAVDPFTTTSTGADSAGGRRLPFGFSYVMRANLSQGESR